MNVKVIGRWMGHLLALAVLLVFLVAAEDSCASEEESAEQAVEEESAVEDEAATAAAEVVEEGRAMFDATATAEVGELAELDAELEYLAQSSLLMGEGLEIIDDFLYWMEDVAFEYGQDVMFPDTAAGELAVDRMKDVTGRVESLNVPLAFQEEYGFFLAAHYEAVTGMELSVAGVEQLDPGLVDQGTVHIVEATRLMSLSTDALERME